MTPKFPKSNLHDPSELAKRAPQRIFIATCTTARIHCTIGRTRLREHLKTIETCNWQKKRTNLIIVQLFPSTPSSASSSHRGGLSCRPVGSNAPEIVMSIEKNIFRWLMLHFPNPYAFEVTCSRATVRSSALYLSERKLFLRNWQSRNLLTCSWQGLSPFGQL